MANTTNWHDRFIQLALHISTWSKDPSTQVGAVITQGKRIVSLGYNGPPQGVMDTFTDRNEKLLRTLHAEENALLFANKSIAGCTIYITHPPCAHCTALLIQAGISHIYFHCPSPEFMGRWKESILCSNTMCNEAHVDLIGITVKESTNAPI